MIDWNSIINNLENGSVVTVDPARWNLDNPKYKEVVELWASNNFNTESVRWINYYDTKEIEIKIAESLVITPLRSWISCVEPGYMTGYHYDIDDDEEEYLKHGKLKRYSIFISKPTIGHVFILNENYHFNSPQGSIIKWDSHRDWHNGINGGLHKKYMFHILGY